MPGIVTEITVHRENEIEVPIESEAKSRQISGTQTQLSSAAVKMQPTLALTRACDEVSRAVGAVIVYDQDLDALILG
jgi:hypothetical protein